ncbi:MAG: hypothetical protein V4501_05400 [Pseudomonadota bacterium]
MLSNNQINEGTCFVCHKTIVAEQALAHLKNCGHATLIREVESVWQIKVATGNEFWIFIEAAGSVTLLDLYIFLRNNWWECCGHASEFIVDGADTAEYYLDKTLNEMFKVGATFHYQHNSGEPVKVIGEVIAVKCAKPIKNICLILRKNMIVESCESCLKAAH